MSSDSKSETTLEGKSSAKKKAAKKAPSKKKSATKKTASKKAAARKSAPRKAAPTKASPPESPSPAERTPQPKERREAKASNEQARTEPEPPAKRGAEAGSHSDSHGQDSPAQPQRDRERNQSRERERDRGDRDRNRERDRERERERDRDDRDGGGRGRRRRGGPVRGRVRGKGRRRGGDGNNNRRGNEQGNDRRRESDDQDERRSSELTGPPVEVNGMLELAPKGFGFLRRPEKDFEQSQDDVFLPPELVRNEGLRVGMWVHGIAREGNRGPQLVEVTSINGIKPERARVLPFFEELKACNPTKRISFETDPNRFTTRVIDMISPIGRGQRGLIVSPPRSGKTTLLLHLAEAVRERHDENLHLMILLVDERPEEVTEFKRQIPEAEIYASSNDMPAKNHCRLAELCIERAKRLVEAGQHVFLLLDSITRLARAYNNNLRGGGKGRGYQSGGIVAGALEMPRRLFAAARNTRGGGSLTIIGTALVQTNAKADEAIFQEFKGTGNMELVLDRKIAEHFVYPAVDIFKSGTRREELLLPEHMLHKIYLIRRGLSGHKPLEAMERLLFFLKKFPNNAQMLLEIKG